MMKLNLPEKIETERLLLQRLRYEDAEELFYTYASKAEATRFVSWPTHQTIRDTRAFLKYAINGWQAGTDYSFSIRDKISQRYIGGLGVLNDKGKIQLGYILGPLHWGKGFATEACLKITEVLKTIPGIYRIGSFVDAENIASSGVLLKAGFEQEARLEKWFKFINQDNQPKDCILYKLPESFFVGDKTH
jgi:[ribosomal protein S5]-alanine N-acetyltransferase